MKHRRSFLLSLLLCSGMILFLSMVQVVTYCQTKPDPSIRLLPNVKRLSRCVNASVPEWCWETPHDYHRPLTIGVVRMGNEIGDFVEATLLRQNLSGIQFVYFDPLEIDMAEVARIYPAHIDGYLLYGGHFATHRTRWPHLPPYGIIGLSDERCDNGPPIDMQPRFGFLTYGDCAIVDNDHFFTMPLGFNAANHPRFLNPLPALQPPSQRRLLFHGEVTMTARKPSRRSWLMEAQQYCWTNHVACDLNTDWWYASGLSTLLWKEHDAYVDALQDAVYTLCPSGNNAEQYRIWEAIAAGSIPIVEDVSDALLHESYVSPAYGDRYACIASDVHAVLKRSGAPILYVKDPTELWRMETNATVLDVQQRALLEWQARLWEHYRLLLTRLLHRHFSNFIS